MSRDGEDSAGWLKQKLLDFKISTIFEVAEKGQEEKEEEPWRKHTWTFEVP